MQYIMHVKTWQLDWVMNDSLDFTWEKETMMEIFALEQPTNVHQVVVHLQKV